MGRFLLENNKENADRSETGNRENEPHRQRSYLENPIDNQNGRSWGFGGQVVQKKTARPHRRKNH